MNIFDRILHTEFDRERRLGNPLVDPFARQRRMNFFASLTGLCGFRQPKKGPKLSKGGSTRREREAHLRPLYLANLEAEADFRARYADQPGYGIAGIRNAIERGEHLNHRPKAASPTGRRASSRVPSGAKPPKAATARGQKNAR